MRSIDNTSNNLTREFKNALSMFEKTYKTGLPILSKSDITKDIWLESGSAARYSGILMASQIPSDDGWRWSQAKSRQIVKLAKENISIEIMKLAPRRSKKNIVAKPPTLKLWKFVIKFNNSKEKQMLLWCERGQSTNDAENIHLSDYMFLAPLMTQNVAFDIWPSLNCY